MAKKTIISRIIDIILIGAVIFLAGRYFYNQPKNISGEKAPDFTAYFSDGTPVNFSKLRGNIVVLDFWASWCGPCRRANPKLVNLYNTYHDAKYKNAGNFEIVSIGLERSTEQWLKAIKADGLNWKYHLSDNTKEGTSVSDLYDVKQIPTKFLIDEEGNIIAVNPSFRKIKKFLDKNLQ